MQIVHALVESGEGKKVTDLLKTLGVDIEDYKLISSPDGDLVIINLLYGNMDILIDNLREHFTFESKDTRSLIIFTPDTVIPRNEKKVKKHSFRATRESLITFAKENSSLNSQFFALVILSSMIAALGLILDNVAVLVGGMVIAPALGPILGTSIGIVLGNYKLMQRGIVAEFFAMLIAITIGFLFGVVVPNVEMTKALEVRMIPTIADLIIAGAAGAAGAYSLLAKGNQSQLVGVMVAASLVPVMSTIGIGISMGNTTMINGALLLLISNFIALLLAVIITLYLKGLKPQIWHENRADKLIKRSLFITLLVVILLSIPLGFITYEEFGVKKPQEKIENIVQDAFERQKNFKLSSLSLKDKDINIFFYSTKPALEEDFLELKREIRNQINEEYQIIYEIVFTQKINH